MSTDTLSVAALRARVTAVSARLGDEVTARALQWAVEHAELIAEVTGAGARHTAARTRRQQYGNTERAADDPQFLRVLADADARCAVASAAADSLISRAEQGSLSSEDAVLIARGLRPLARDAVRALFETLGASSTLTEHGLQAFWVRLHELDAVRLP